MTMRTPNIQLSALVAESGLTYEVLAKAVCAVAAECGARLRTNKSNVEHWLSGSVPRGDAPRYLAVALSRRLGRLLTPADLGFPSPAEAENETIGLSLGNDPLDVLLPMWRYDLDRRHFLTASAYSVAAAALPLTHIQDIAARTAAARTGQTVGTAEVAAVRDMIHAFSEMDERHGGQHGRSALLTYLRDDVAPLCRARFRTDEARRQMLSAASRGVHLLGWKSYDAGQQGLAQRYYLQSYALAAESGLRGHDGFVMRTMAMQGLKLHRPECCLGLAESGLNRAKGRVDAQTEALFRVVHAHTLAKTGKRRAALAEAEHARTPTDRRPRRRNAVLGAGLGPTGRVGVLPYRQSPRGHGGPPGRRRAVRPGRHSAPGRPCADRRPGPGRGRGDASQARQHRADVRHLAPGHRPHERCPFRPHPKGSLPHAQRPRTLPGPRPAVRSRARRTRARLPRQRLTSAAPGEAADDRLQVVRVGAGESGQFGR